MSRKILPAAAGAAFMFVLLAAPWNAEAQVSFSGSLHISGELNLSASLVINEPAPPPPPPPAPVVVAPPPPVVVQPAPVVVVPPAAAPVVIVKKERRPPPKVVIKAPPLRPVFEKQIGVGFMGQGVYLGRSEADGLGMGGGGLLMRMRLVPHFAMELAAGTYAGKGYDGARRVEIPFTVGFMWMPAHYLSRVQFYTTAGMGTSLAGVGEDPHKDKPFYLGGFLGLGLELKFGARRNVALFADMKGFVRKRLNDMSDDPLAPDGGSCRGEGAGRECTDWEGGLTTSIGLLIYF